MMPQKGMEWEKMAVRVGKYADLPRTHTHTHTHMPVFPPKVQMIKHVPLKSNSCAIGCYNVTRVKYWYNIGTYWWSFHIFTMRMKEGDED